MSQTTSTPTFMGIPRKLRNEIYRNLVVVNRGPERVPDPSPKENIDPAIFAVSRQVRKESREICCDENFWIVISLTPSDDHQADVDLLKTLVRRPQATVELRSEDVGPFTSRACLTVYLGQGCGEPEKVVPQGKRLVSFFAFNQRAFAYLCNDLSSFANRYSCMSLELGERLSTYNPDSSRLLIPLSLIRGLEKVTFNDPSVKNLLQMMTETISGWPQMLGILSTWKTVGNKFFRKKKYAQAAHFYDCGQDAFTWLREIALHLGLGFDSVSSNDFQSLTIDLGNNLSLAINKLVESRREGPDHCLANISVQQLDLSLNEADENLKWPGVLDQQRKKAHFNRAVAFRNKADWENDYGQETKNKNKKGIGKARGYLEEAAKDFFCANQLMQPAERNPTLLAKVNRRLGRSATTGEHAPVCNMYVIDSDTSFKGDSRLLDIWGMPAFGHLHLLRRRSPPATQ